MVEALHLDCHSKMEESDFRPSSSIVEIRSAATTKLKKTK